MRALPLWIEKPQEPSGADARDPLSRLGARGSSGGWGVLLRWGSTRKGDASFLAGAPEVAAVVVGFNGRSVQCGEYPKDTASRARVPCLELTGFESPSEVGSAVLSQWRCGASNRIGADVHPV